MADPAEDVDLPLQIIPLFAVLELGLAVGLDGYQFA